MLYPTLAQNLEKQSSKFRKRLEVGRILARLGNHRFRRSPISARRNPP